MTTTRGAYCTRGRSGVHDATHRVTAGEPSGDIHRETVCQTHIPVATRQATRATGHTPTVEALPAQLKAPPELALFDEGPSGGLRPAGALIADWIAANAPPEVT